MLDTAKEFSRFLFTRKKIWLIPLVLLLLIIGGILMFAQTSPIGPFIYTMF